VHARIQSYLRSVAPIGREQQSIGPFLATYSPGNDNPYLNYAIPNDGAQPTPDDVAALIDAYRSRHVRPRLEYVSGLAPEVEASLLAAGFVAEGRLPVLATSATALLEPERPAGITFRPPTSDDDVWRMATVQAEAYQEPPPPREAAVGQGARFRDLIAVIAVDAGSGAVVGAGSCSPIRDGLTEVAAIGVAVSHRRRGIGAGLAHGLAAAALDRGAVTPWLMAAHDAERRIYERVGFAVIGEILHISYPPEAGGSDLLPDFT
jgi:GNAT superfamily N-acetyltransferase